MVDYTFTTDQGWRVTEYRPFSPSYAILHPPSMQSDWEARRTGYTRSPTDSLYPVDPVKTLHSENLLQKLTGQQLKFDYFSADVLRQLLEERVAIRDRNRSSILGHIAEVSGHISGGTAVQNNCKLDR